MTMDKQWRKNQYQYNLRLLIVNKGFQMHAFLIILYRYWYIRPWRHFMEASGMFIQFNLFLCFFSLSDRNFFGSINKILMQLNSKSLIITIFFTAVAYFFYILWLRPRQIIKGYVKELKKRGYHVLELPFNPFKSQMLEAMRKGASRGDVFDLFKNERTDYDVIVSNTFASPRLQLHHPDFLKDFFSLDRHYEYPKTKNVVQVYERIAGRGLTFSEGHNWRRKRSIFNKIFNFDFLKSQSKRIANICTRKIQNIQNEMRENKKGGTISYNILDLTVNIFSTVMMQIFLGCSSNELIQGQSADLYLKRLLNDISKSAFNPLSFLLGPKFLKLGLTAKQRDIDRRIMIYRSWGLDLVRKRVDQAKGSLQRNNNQPANIIEAIILANYKQQQKGERDSIMETEEIFQQFTTFYIAGTDTTANYTQMMLYQIARHPEVQAKLRQQISNYMKDDDYSYQNLKRFTYIDLLQKQVTRTYGPLNLLFSRKAQNDTYLNNLKIFKGTGVSIFYVSNHHSPKYFKDPKKFRPERWESECNEINPFALGGFSAGSRTCLGKHLALLQNKIALIKFLKRYNKIVLPKENFRMQQKFLYSPEDFLSTLIINSENINN